MSFLGIITGFAILIISQDFTFHFHIQILLVIIGQGIGNLLYFVALERLSSSTSQIIFSSIIFFNAVLGVLFYNLNLIAVNYLGLIILIFAIFMVLSKRIEGSKLAVGIMFLSAFFFAINQLSSGVISKDSSLGVYMIASYLGGVIAPVIYKPKFIISDLKLLQKNILLLYTPLITSFFATTYYLFAYYAYRLAPIPAKVAMILTGQVVLAVLLSYFFFHEKRNLYLKILASLLVVVGAILIKL